MRYLLDTHALLQARSAPGSLSIATPSIRMLVAQARLGGLTLVSRDANVARYDVAIVRA